MNILPDFPGQSPVTPVQPAKPRRKRWLALLYGAAGLLLLLLVVLVLTAVFFPVDMLKGHLIKAVEGQTGLRCTIGSLSSNALGGSFSLREFALTDPRRDLPTPLLYLKDARLRVALTSLPGFFAGRPLVLDELHIESGSFNSLLFEPAPQDRADSRAVSAPEPPAVPVAATARAVSVTTKQSVVVKYIEVADVRIFGRASQTESPALRIRNGEIRQRATREYVFNLNVLGKNSGELTMQGEISELEFPAFDRAVLQSKALCAGLMQGDIYEALGLPVREDSFRLAPLDGTLEMVHQAGKTSLQGKVASQELKIASLPPFAGVKLDFAVAYDLNREHFSFSRVVAQAGGGISLDGSGELMRTQAGWQFQSALKDTVLPAALLFGIIGKPEYNKAVHGLLRLQGALGNTGAEGWGFSGKVAAEKFALSAINPDNDGHITAGIECSEKSQKLVLRDLKVSLGALELSGSAALPLGNVARYADLRIDLNGRIDAGGLKHLQFPFNSARGVLELRAEAGCRDGQILEYRLALNSGKGSPFMISLAGLPLPADAGEIAFLAEGNLALSGGAHVLKQARITSKVLAAEVSLQPKQAGTECVYALQFTPQPVLPLLEYFLPTMHQPAEQMQSLTAQGRAVYIPDTGALTFSDFSLGARFVDGLTATLTGDYSAVVRERVIRGSKVLLLLADGGKKIFSAQSGFDWALEANPARNDALDVQMSGDLGRTLQLVNECGYLKSLAGARSMAAFNLRVRRQNGDITLAGAANLGRFSLPLSQTRNLQAPSLQVSTDLILREQASLLDVKSLRVASPDGLLSVNGSGQLRFTDGLSGLFSMKSEADLAALLQMSGEAGGGTPWLSGRISTIVNLAGTALKPEIVLSCSAPDLMLGTTAPLHKLVQPLLQAHIAWEATPEGVRNLVLSDFSLKTPNESLVIKGKADAVRLRADALDFGRGCAANFQLRSTRSMLAFVFPRINLLVREPGKPDALSFSGQLVATSIPLPNPFADGSGGVAIPKGFSLRNSIFRLDELRTDYIALTDIMGEPSLRDGVLLVEKGSGDLGGPLQFGLTMDFNQKPVAARATTSGINLNLPDCLSGLKIRTRFDSGKLSFPWPLDRQKIVVTWSGLDMPSIKKSLLVEETGIHIDEMRLTTKLRMPDFKRMLSYDLPEELAAEGAKRMEDRFAARYASPISPYYKSIDLSFKIKDEVLTVTRCYVGGGDTADFELEGKLFLDGKLDMYLRPVKNMSNTFDAATVTDLPQIRKVILGLPAEQQEKARSILPGWLEEAANRRKLAIHIINDVNNPTIDPKDVRDRIKSELPYIMQKIQELLNDKELLKGLLGEKDAKAVGNFLEGLNK